MKTTGVVLRGSVCFVVHAESENVTVTNFKLMTFRPSAGLKEESSEANRKDEIELHKI